MNNENCKTVRLGDVILKADIMRNESQDYPILSMTMHEGFIFQKDRFSKQIASIDRSNYLVVKRNQLVQSFSIDEGVLDINRISDFGIVIPLPPLATKKHIAAVLDKCTAVFAKHKLMLEKYDTLIKSRFVGCKH